jgi:serine phosphatase RsbU (regulator of sigma subunit)
LKKLTEGAGILATGDFKHRVEVKTKDELSTLADAFNKMAQELEISTKALVYKERVAKELELAAKIQKDILPKTIPKVPGLDISAGLLPAEEIGGDSYDFLKLSDDELLMYLGDVTGHGVPSGIVVSVANALIYNFANTSTIKDLLVSVNRILKEKTSSNMFMTLVMLKWIASQGKLKYVSAGHEQMVHFHAAEKKVTLTPAGGIALGMLNDISKTLNENEVLMEKDDTLIIYSDGIPECWKNEKEMYGMARLKRAVSEYSDLPTAFALRNALLADVKEFAGKYKQMDDITLIVLKRT